MPVDERVLVIPTDRFRAAGYFHGFRPDEDGYRAAVLDPAAYQFRPRSEVETEPAFKQLIPYVVLRHGDALFHYRRGAGGTESRLRALRSVGIGGHISEEDAAGGTDPYHTGMMRELMEEVLIGGGWSERFLGFINDDSTPVGSVHLGVGRIQFQQVDAGFAPLAELAAREGEFETWSQFVLRELSRG